MGRGRTREVTRQAISPRVSVLMAVHNGETYLRRAVDSILAQTFADFEFIIVNDGSTDSTAAVLEEYQEQDHRIRVYGQKNRGLLTSLQQGCDLARGEYVARMDADDIAFPERLERQVCFLEQNPGVALVGGAVVVVDETGGPFHTTRYPVQDRQIKEAIYRYNPFAHPAIIVRKQALLAVGGYRKPFVRAQDYDLWLRLSERFELANLPEPVLYYRAHSDQVSIVGFKQQAVCTLAAQAAARIRWETGLDPVSGVEQVTPDVLARLGVGDEIVQKALVEGCLSWANLMVQTGRADVALPFLDEASKCFHDVGRDVGAKVHWGYTKLFYKEGQLLRCAISAMKACLVDPSFPLKLVWRRLRRLFLIAAPSPTASTAP
ncbi:MAG: glycosyltransferase [Dehalococcoidia bacterium]